MTDYTTAIVAMVVVGVVLTGAVMYALMRPTDLPMLKRNKD
ncbi:MAG: hypothetical protein O2972_04240 [Cyanobacteria bacterium]|jgi:hypothetical protein|nr:hypothetical protein [Cyanobacteriota bacterium]